MKAGLKFLFIGLMFLCFAGIAQATTVLNFEGAPTGYISGTEYSGSGVLFSTQGGSGAQESDYGGLYTEVITSSNWYNPLVIDFVNPANSGEDWIVTSVSMFNHFSEDYWTVTAYDINGSLLDTKIVNYQSMWVGFSGVGDIHSVKIDDGYSTAFAMDDLTFDGLAAPGQGGGPTIPEPTSMLLFAVGALGTFLKRKVS